MIVSTVIIMDSERVTERSESQHSARARPICADEVLEHLGYSLTMRFYGAREILQRAAHALLLSQNHSA